jgi:transcriptional regulator GlxA family with amidase domain
MSTTTSKSQTAVKHAPLRKPAAESKRMRVALLVYPGLQILDAAGPAAVFTTANRCIGRHVYEVDLVSSSGQAVPSNSAVTVLTRPLRQYAARHVHTFLLVGGESTAVAAAMRDRALTRWLKQAAKFAARYGSVCTGTFVLAAAGLLQGRRVATHWEGCAELAQRFPTLSVDSDALYVEDGPVWTSAGVTTGIDMALYMVERDLGAAVASEVAQRLVVYSRRPGHQSQFSPLLLAQCRSDAPYAALIDWMQAHLHETLDVERLAKRAGQSERDFHRKFQSALGETPARFVESLRLDQVRALLLHDVSLKEIAQQTGFGSAVRLSRSFERRFGVKPSLFREMQPRDAAED